MTEGSALEEPVGHTIDGTPWVEQRAPHLPDPVTGAAGRVPFAAWVFFAIAAVVLVWELRDIGSRGSIGSPVDVLVQVAGVIPSVAACLFGGFLFLRHPQARSTDPLLVFGVSLLAVVELMQIGSSLLRDTFAMLTPPTGEGEIYVPAAIGFSTLTRLFSAFGLVYVARGLVDAREHDDARGGRRRLIVWALVAVVGLTMVSTLGQIAWYWTNGVIDHADRWAVINLGSILVTTTLTAIAWAYLAATSVAGAAAGERPRGAWRFATAGTWAIVLVTLLGAVWTWALTFIQPTDQPNDLLLWPYRFLSYTYAAGFLLLLAAFAKGLPGLDVVEPNVEEPDVAEPDVAEPDVMMPE
jgi:hypothetical protein